MSAVLEDLCLSLRQREHAGLTDGQLLGRFLANRDEDAFRTLVQRHGPMVLGVCRRILANGHDADDAFQATFLVLAVKAGRIVPRDAVGAWLHGVAYRTAKKAKAMNARRVHKEQQFHERRPASVAVENGWEELQPVLDEELNRLPEKYRSAIVLCDLEGRTKKEAAGRLYCPEGTLSSWLVRGRRLLARRLTRRGVTLSAGSLAVVLAQNAACAAVARSLVVSAGKAATRFAAGPAAAAGAIPARVAALTEGVLKSMLLKRIKIALLIVLVFGVFGGGVVLRDHPSVAADPAPPLARADRPEPPPEAQADEASLLIAKVLKAHGGEAALGKLDTFTLRMKGTSVENGESDELRCTAQAPGKVRFEVSYFGSEPRNQVTVVNGDRKWQKVNDGEATEIAGVQGAEVDHFLKYFGPRAMLQLKDPEMQVTVLGERPVGDSVFDDRKALCARLARKDGKEFSGLYPRFAQPVSEVLLYFDKDSNLLLKEEWSTEGKRHQLFCGDYKRINGIAVARKLALKLADGPVSARGEVEFEVPDRVDARLFQKP
jgi:RNA polymerase sigma factor (sigma-70 family)